MRPVVPLALALALVAGVGVWFLMRARPQVVMPLDETSVDAPSRTAPAPVTATTGGELASSPTVPRTPRIEGTPAPTEVKFGAVTITLVPPAGVELPKSLSFDVQPLDFAHPPKPLPAEQPDGTWRYDNLPSGRWRVRAFVPGFVDASTLVNVRPESETSVSLPLEVGGAASWKVALTTGVAPELVRVTLLDGRGISIAGTYQTAGTTLHANPSSVPALPAEGKVVGLKVGRYRLRASTLDGDPTEQSFEVKAGETAALEFTLPR